jgi:hypothetical protein
VKTSAFGPRHLVTWALRSREIIVLEVSEIFEDKLVVRLDQKHAPKKGSMGTLVVLNAQEGAMMTTAMKPFRVEKIETGDSVDLITVAWTEAASAAV